MTRSEMREAVLGSLDGVSELSGFSSDVKRRAAQYGVRKGYSHFEKSVGWAKILLVEAFRQAEGNLRGVISEKVELLAQSRSRFSTRTGNKPEKLRAAILRSQITAAAYGLNGVL